MSTIQRIRDPLHSLVEFGDDEFDVTMWKLVQTAPFQRLRRVKQLGFSDYVYPGATHSRFAHSVGVFHTARQILGAIREKLGTDFSDRKAEAAKAAALLHDVGHGPFSHAFETVGKKFDLKLAQHELVSDSLIRDSEITEVLNELSGGFAEEVAAIIRAKGPRRIYDTVVSSQFDADRLDYMRRDRMMAGSKHGGIDYDWLIANLEIAEIPTGVDDVQTGTVSTLAVGTKSIAAAEAYVLGLFQLYPTIYFHKTTRGVEKVFHALIERLFNLILDGTFEKTGLPKKHALVRFTLSPADMNIAQELDDMVIWGSLHLMADAEDEVVSELSKRLIFRKLYKCFDVRNAISATKRIDDVAERSAYIDRISAKVLEKIEMWKKDKGHKVLIDKGLRSPYKKFEESKGPLNQILVKSPSGKIQDLAEISPIVAAIKDFTFMRMYFDDSDHVILGGIEDIVKGECK